MRQAREVRFPAGRPRPRAVASLLGSNRGVPGALPGVATWVILLTRRGRAGGARVALDLRRTTSRAVVFARRGDTISTEDDTMADYRVIDADGHVRESDRALRSLLGPLGERRALFPGDSWDRHLQ